MVISFSIVVVVRFDCVFDSSFLCVLCVCVISCQCVNVIIFCMNLIVISVSIVVVVRFDCVFGVVSSCCDYDSLVDSGLFVLVHASCLHEVY